MWWCYRASICAIGVTSLALSDSPLFSHIKSPNHKSPTDWYSQTQSTLATDRRSWWLNRKTTALHTAVQVLIYKVNLAYKPDGRLAVDANAGEACNIPDRAMPVWRMEESSRHTIPPSREGFRYEDVTLTFTSRQTGRLGLDRQVDLVWLWFYIFRSRKFASYSQAF